VAEVTDPENIVGSDVFEDRYSIVVVDKWLFRKHFEGHPARPDVFVLVVP
jgi:hypothetical protein